MCFYHVPFVIFIHQTALEIILTKSAQTESVGKVVKIEQFHLACDFITR